MSRAPLRAPDFFLVGAPKCGTTALSEYLRAHPEIGFSRPKEPHYFATDRPFLRQMESEEEYLRLAFAHCRERSLLGEGSTHYLLSETAVPNALACNPKARFIALVRNPIELASALHHDNVYNLVEDELDFERAWRLQEARAGGDRVPRRCRTPELLQYGRTGMLGAHLERLLREVPRAQLLVAVFDDFQRDPGLVYRRVLAFLGARDDGRREFPVLNERRLQSVWYRRVAGALPPELGRAALSLRRALGLPELGLRRRLGEASAQPEPRPVLRPAFRAELAAFFRSDVARLSHLLERDLGHWLADTEAGRTPALASAGAALRADR
jgi:hypothetical protein